MRKILTSALAATLGLAVSLGSASANVISVPGGATITCTSDIVIEPVCQAFTGGAPDGNDDPTTAGVLSSTMADLYGGQPSNEADEANAINILTGGATSFVGTDGDKNDPPVNPLTTLAEFVILKLGNSRVILQNVSGGEITITYVGASSLGLSHTTEFGEVSEIPLPAAIWLMGAGIAGLGFSSRMKKKA